MNPVLEKDQRIPNSLLWNRQSQYYLQQGITAWKENRVPHQASSNPYIGQYYANMIVMFALDLIDQHQHTAPEPLLIIELGSGPGLFTQYCIESLNQLFKSTGNESLAFQYIALDLVSRNLESYKDNATLSSFIDQGRLDCATCDLTNPTQFTLQQSQETLKWNALNSNVVVIANYVLDSLPIEMLKIEGEQLHVAHITTTKNEIKAQQKTRVQHATTADLNTTKLNDLHHRFEYHLIAHNDPYITEKDLAIIKRYQTLTSPVYIEYPIATLRLLDTIFSSPARNKLVITSDKGIQGKHSLNNGNQSFSLVEHDNCFSTTVNYYMIKEYINAYYGFSKTLEKDPVFSTHLLGSGVPMNRLTRLNYFTQSNLPHSPLVHLHLTQQTDLCRHYWAKIKTSHFDPNCIKQNLSQLFSLYFINENFPPKLYSAFKRCLEHTHNLITEPKDHAVKIFLLFAIEEYQKAIFEYKKISPKEHHLIAHQIIMICYKNLGIRKNTLLLHLRMITAKCKKQWWILKTGRCY